MKGPRGYVWAYNAQAAAGEDGLIVAAGVSDQATDNHLFDPMVAQACDNLHTAGMDQPGAACADNGYWTNHNATPKPADAPGPQPQPTRPRPEPHIAPPTDKRRRRLATRGPIPQGATPAQIMERRLATKQGAAIYNRRAVTIEPIFGQIKAARGINRFRRRGLQAARHEWRLIATTHNITKMWRHQLAIP